MNLSIHQPASHMIFRPETKTSRWGPSPPLVDIIGTEIFSKFIQGKLWQTTLDVTRRLKFHNNMSYHAFTNLAKLGLISAGEALELFLDCGGHSCCKSCRVWAYIMAFSSFFKSLGERLRRENNLSDLTYAILKTVPKLKMDLLTLFDLPIKINEPIDIEREYGIGKTSYHIDFAFTLSDCLFLLENKIWDRNYHFPEYNKAIKSIGRNNYKNVYLAIISNHNLAEPLVKKYNWRLLYWDRLIRHIEKQEYREYQPLVTGYIKYVKEICDMVEIKEEIRFETKAIISIYQFTLLVDQIISSASHGNYQYSRHTAAARAFGDSHSGYYYKIVNLKKKKEAYPWFGVTYYDTLKICISLDDDWNGKIVNKLKN